jgi:hypothetical protein
MGQRTSLEVVFIEHDLRNRIRRPIEPAFRFRLRSRECPSLGWDATFHLNIVEANRDNHARTDIRAPPLAISAPERRSECSMSQRYPRFYI